ncbi:hypothetical protein SKAU_G00379570 [Synaphobranchus kaupii]|uniref:IF rod domain-containing protein n=1 Tax=Synaphobranchus kaupii TaxID=118154 RepID=A0A9Q1IEI5_SYNKA|nr:hypothetical protein SKAU_G00379570 [Synaphobranchus kaupii]
MPTCKNKRRDTFDELQFLLHFHLLEHDSTDAEDSGTPGSRTGRTDPIPRPVCSTNKAIGGPQRHLGSGRGARRGPVVGPILSRQAEKHMLSGLNDRFSAYMIKVRALQQENATLEAKLSQLTGGTDMSPDSSTSTIEYEAQLGEYRLTLENLTLDTIKLEIELDNVRGAAHELKAKFDFEQGVRFQLEADIGSMKKVREKREEKGVNLMIIMTVLSVFSPPPRILRTASDLRIELDTKFSSLRTELDYVTRLRTRSFDISAALGKMRKAYDESVHQHREEADAYYRLKMDEIQTTTAQSTEAIGSAKVEIASAKKDLQGLG